MKIGNIVLENNVILAPMAGVTDLAFRLICKELGAGLIYTEMVSSKGLYYQDKRTEEFMIIDQKERPVALQIFGSDPEVMRKVTMEKLNQREDIDIIDINMGCPTPKIVKNGDGSALVKTPTLAGEVAKAVVKASNKPVTAKIRIGWDNDNINAVEVAKILENSGVSALAVHGRTREQFYTGAANWNIIKEVKKSISIPVIGNGDIFEPEDGKRMIDETGCDAIMIGRGSRGNPWIFNRTAALLQNGEEIQMPSDLERIKICIKHFELLCNLKGERIAVKEMRKHISWYIKGMKNSAEMRNRINTIQTKVELVKELDEFVGSSF